MKDRDYSVEEILAEAQGRFGGKSYEELIGEEAAKTPAAIKKPAQTQPRPEKAPPSTPKPDTAPSPASRPEAAPRPAPDADIRFEAELEDEEIPEKRGLFGRKKKEKKEKKQKGFDEEEDIYYGLQLKAIDDYKKGYEEDGQEKPKGPSAAFSYLFDGTQESDVDEEIAARFDTIHKNEQHAQPVKKPSRPDGHGKVVSIYSHSDPTKKDSLDDLLDEPVRNKTLEFKVPEGKTPAVKAPQAQPKPRPQTKGPQPRVSETLVEEPPKAAKPEPPVVAPERAVSVPLSERAKAKPVTEMHVKEMPVPMPERRPEPAAKQEVPPKPQVQPKPQSAPKPDFEPEPKAAANVSAAPVLTEEERKSLQREQVKKLLEKAPQFAVRSHDVHLIEIDQLDAALEQEAQCYGSATLAQKLSVTPEEDAEADDEEGMGHKRKKKKKGGAHRFRFTGDAEEDNDPSEELPGDREEIDDFSAPEDAPSIAADLNTNIGRLGLRLTVTAISGILLLVWGLLSEKFGMLPDFLQMEIPSLVYLIVNACFLLVAVGFCWNTVWGGIKSLVRLQASSDSAVAVAAVASLVQSGTMFFAPNELMRAHVHLYSTLAVAALFLNTVGKLTMVRRINRNFHFIASPEQKVGVELYDDYNNALRLAKGCVADTPIIAYQKKTDFFKNFLRNSYEADPSELASQSLAPLTFILSLVLCIVTVVISQSTVHAVTAFAAAACVSVPFTNMVAANLPISRLCKLGRRCGTMLVGYPTVEHFCNTNAVMLDAKDLFPKGTVILNGLKTFGNERVDDAIMEATALMCAAGGPLSDLFDQIIKSRREMLPKVENISYEDEMGIVGWVAGKRVLVGNRDLMERHHFSPPSHDYEDKYLLGGKKIIYLAAGGELVAMFIISYNSDKRRALELQRMEDNGVSLIVRTTDPNITSEFLAQCFGLDVHSVKVLPEMLGDLYQKLTQKPTARADALFATKGRTTAMMRMITACIREKSNITLATILQNVAVILGLAMVGFMACWSGLQQLTTTALLVYELFWILVVLIVPRLRKP